MLLAAPGSATSLRSGEVFAARYRIEAPLGRCGSCDVYRVLDEHVGQRRALKCLGATDASTRPLRWQLEREYQTLAQLADPGLLQVYDAGVSEGASYYTLELLEGANLQERGKLPFRDACRLLQAVAASLATLHARRLLHRDICARNVGTTADDRAKLFDFSSLARAGLPGRQLGTPAFLAPEAAMLQTLDARADLFSLGALLYWSLTGRSAYAARSFSQLEAAWRTPPPAPSRYAADVPHELDELVLQLLAVERTLRPTSAAWVAERLAPIAGLDLGRAIARRPVPAIVPKLVGRSAELGRLRDALERASEGRGGAVLLESAEGIGRSRLLDEGVLESKRLGAIVLRGDASEGPRPYALIRSLATQLYQAAPDLAAQLAAPRRAWLGQLAPELSPEAIVDGASDSNGCTPRDPTALERPLLNSAARDWFLSVARTKHLVIAVDDVDRVDAASTAILAMLAHGAPRRRLSILLCAIENAGPSATPLTVIRSAAAIIVVPPLSAEESEALGHSILQDTSDVSALAAQIARPAGGSPRWIVALAESIAETRSTAKEGAVQAHLAQHSPHDIPETRGEALAASIAALDQDARELGQALCLAAVGTLPATTYAALTQHRDARRTHRAVAALEQSGMLLCEADHHRFSDAAIAPLLLLDIDPERAKTLHARIAEALPPNQQSAERFHHLVLAGDERRALDCVVGVPLDTARLRDLTLKPEALDRLLAAALRLSAAPGAQPIVHELLLRAAARTGEYSAFLRIAEAFRAQLEVAQVHADTPRLAALLLTFVTLSDAARDAALLARLPTFGALAAPGLRLLDATVGGHLALQQGNETLGLQRSRELLRLLEGPHAGIDAQLVESLRRGQQYLQGLYAAARGARGTIEWILELERSRSHRAHAWRVRAIYELAYGRFELGNTCRQRAELLALQDGVEDPLPGTSLALELLAVLYAADQPGLARLRPRATELAARSAGFQPIATIADAYALLQHDPHVALDLIAPLLPGLKQSPNSNFVWIATAHVHALRRLRRLPEAVESGVRYVDAWTRSELGPRDGGLRQALSEAQLELGCAADARKTNREDLRILELSGMRGVVLSLARVTRARIALALEDAAEARAYASRGLREHHGAESPRLTEALAQLRDHADRSRIHIDLTVTKHDPAAPVPPIDEGARVLFNRLVACVSAQDRAKEGLRLLLSDVVATTGYLFGLRGGRLRCLASTEPRQAPAALVALLEDTLRVELEQDGDAARAAAPAGVSTASFRFIDDWGREFEPLLLFGRTQGEPVLTGIAALHYELSRRSPPSAAVVEALTEALIAIDFIDPITRFS